jgi:hypothetical protein
MEASNERSKFEAAVLEEETERAKLAAERKKDWATVRKGGSLQVGFEQFNCEFNACSFSRKNLKMSPSRPLKRTG